MICKTLLEGVEVMPIYSLVLLSLPTPTSALSTTLSIWQFFWGGQLSVFLQLQLTLAFAVGAVAALVLDRISMSCLDI